MVRIYTVRKLMPWLCHRRLRSLILPPRREGDFLAHRAAERSFEAASGRVDEIAAKQRERVIRPPDHAAFDAAGELERAARGALLSAVPITGAGVRAGLEYAMAIDWAGEHLCAFAETLLKSAVLAA